MIPPEILALGALLGLCCGYALTRAVLRAGTREQRLPATWEPAEKDGDLDARPTVR